MTALQKAKLRGTQKDIATTLTDYLTDRARPPANNGTISNTFKSALTPMYIKVLPMRDQWGGSFIVQTGTAVNMYGITGALIDDYLLVSYGRNRTIETWTYSPASPEGGLYTLALTTDFDRDLVNFLGSFIRGPRSGT
jgi:hypothetical protein